MYAIDRKYGIDAKAEGYEFIVIMKGEFGETKITRRPLHAQTMKRVSRDLCYCYGFTQRAQTKWVSFRAYRKIFGDA